MKNNSLKILTGLLSLTLLVACTPDKPTSSENPITSSQAPSSEIINSSQSSSETPVVEKGYKIKLGETKIELTKGATEGNITNYETTLESVVEGTEVTFYVDGKEKKPSCADLGNNIVLNEEYKTIIHNNASNVKLTLRVSTNGLEVFLEGYTQKVINAFTATVIGEASTLTSGTPSTGKVAKFTITLAIGDKLTVLGDGTPLYIGENAMHFEKEYTAPLPGEYVIEVNEYNRILITEPVLEVHELYLVYINDQQIEPTFVTPANPEDKAEFSFEMKKGDTFKVLYVDGTTLGSGEAKYNYTHKVYINKEGNYYPEEKDIQVNISATVNGEPLILTEKNPGNDLAVYIIKVEANQIIQFLLDGEPLSYKDSSETTFMYAESGEYKIFINKSCQVWDQPYVETVPYGVRGTFDGGDWQTTLFMTKVNDDQYEIVVTASAAAEFKVVEVKEDDPDYILKWIGNGEANVKLSKGTYKITYTVSTNKITVTAA